MDNDNYQWAQQEFGQADIGDFRRKRRVLQMAAALVANPAGRVSSAFEDDAQRQGAYGLLENKGVGWQPLVESMTNACAARCRGHDFVYVPIDHVVISLVDRTGGTKGFGCTGGRQHSHARAVMVMNALAFSSQAVPLGVADQQYWIRPEYRLKSPQQYQRLFPEDKETGLWINAAERIVDRFHKHSPNTRCWFQADRYADTQAVLKRWQDTGHFFTVRSRISRRLQSPDDRRVYLYDYLKKQPLRGILNLQLPRRGERPAQRIRVSVRASRVTLRVKDAWAKWSHLNTTMELNAVMVHSDRPLAGESGPLMWVLLTNYPIDTQEQLVRIVFGYTVRWAIEEHHRCWKSGVCNVEQSQLRSFQAFAKWATLLAAVAARVEHLKKRARVEPSIGADQELSSWELKALIILKKRQKRRNEVVDEKTVPTLGQAVRWIAELGGYVVYNPDPPGSTTIARGLSKVCDAAMLLEALNEEKCD